MLKDAARGVQKDISNIASKLPTAALRMGAKIAQDVGDGASFVGYGLTLTVAGSEVGIPLAKAGNIVSNAGDYMEIAADFLDGDFDNFRISVIKKIAIDIAQNKINKKIDKIPGASKLTKEILKQNIDVKVKGAERLYDHIQDKKTGESKGNNKVSIEKN